MIPKGKNNRLAPKYPTMEAQNPKKVATSAHVNSFRLGTGIRGVKVGAGGVASGTVAWGGTGGTLVRSAEQRGQNAV